MNWSLLLLVFIFKFLSTECTDAENELVSRPLHNVCNKTTKYIVNKTQEIYYNVQVKENTWCFSIPPRCSVSKTYLRRKTVTVPTFEEKSELECCDGYKKEDSGDCSPICDFSCGLHGTCIKPTICSCDEGFMGKYCHKECDPDQYGKNCDKFCSCQNGASCDKRDGTCHCAPGFTGTFCETLCPKQSYGWNCENTCKCENGATCHPSNGTCDCTPGYNGQYCERKCKHWAYGEGCNNVCHCSFLMTESCNHISGECNCIPGRKGKQCDEKCGPNTWGPACKNACSCSQNSTCHHATGDCSCPPGYLGPACDQKCPVGFYEADCKMRCPECNHEAQTCHHVTGWCTCPDGSTGHDCDLECPEGQWGSQCEEECLCTHNSTCDPVTGSCTCPSGWSGVQCSMPCQEGSYGEGCNSSCDCADKFTCNPIDGRCCEDKWNSSECETRNLLRVSEPDGSYILQIGLSIAIIAFLVLAFAGIVYLIRRHCKCNRLFKTTRRNNDVVSSERTVPALSTQSYGNPTYESRTSLRSFIRQNPPARFDLTGNVTPANSEENVGDTKVKSLTDSEENLLKNIGDPGKMSKFCVLLKGAVAPKKANPDSELKRNSIELKDNASSLFPITEENPFRESCKAEISLKEDSCKAQNDPFNPQCTISEPEKKFEDFYVGDDQQDIYSDVENAKVHFYERPPEKV